MNSHKTFVFKSHKADLIKGEVLFSYVIKLENKNIDFTEKISFPPVGNKLPEALLKSLLDNLMLILGISYWKLYCPKNLVLESISLTKEQAEFWNTVYTKGMGEFFYKNKIDFRGLVRFSYAEKAEIKPVAFPRKDRTLLGLGGGKDSIVVAEMFREQNKNFDVLTMASKIQREVALTIGKSPIVVKRELDAKLFKLNGEKGAYNGHIPVSVVYALLGIMAGIFYDYNNFVVGNEKSANYGNVEYLGEMINHQWSKSEGFEALFNNYVHQFITPDIVYSSPLRNMTELQVVQEFVKYPQYFRAFSSCNSNFKVSAPLRSDELRRGKWCGKCAKCLFVFICLSVFLPKEKILEIFGKNLLDDKSLIPLFEELIGVRNFKPFECVGTPEEVKEALGKIAAKGKFNENILIKHFKNL